MGCSSKPREDGIEFKTQERLGRGLKLAASHASDRRCAVGDGPASMLKSLELLSSSIASALDDQKRRPCSMVKAQRSPRVRVVLPAKDDTRCTPALEF